MIISAFAIAVGAAIVLIGGLGAVIASESAVASDEPHAAGYV